MVLTKPELMGYLKNEGVAPRAPAYLALRRRDKMAA